MKYGVYLPNFGKEASARAFAELAIEAEEAGWDGFFIWDHILHSLSQRVPLVDPWVTLGAVAIRTEQIRIGTTVTPVARRRPWKLAREAVTLDHLSNGRLTIAVGLGDPAVAEYAQFGEEPDARIRAEKLDEGLDILVGLMKGKPFAYEGKHFTVEKSVFLPSSVQSPRMPIWVGGFWPHQRPFQRAARWDGVFPLKVGGGMKRKDLEAIREYIAENRTATAPFDVVVTGSTPGDDMAKGRKTVASFAAGGMTWWLEGLYARRDSFDAMRSRIRQGPPRIE
jgi:alkanesulfonate monooxygenase SsuD/methylene tetrahydromethanopterin reductase-like flavin-dependent oxidoreductase (luciferase family)